MKLSIGLGVTALLILADPAPLVAGPLSAAVLEGGSRVTDLLPAAFGDGPPTGPRHARRNHAGAVAKPVEPYHADMNGATRDGADKIYRKQFGF